MYFLSLLNSDNISLTDFGCIDSQILKESEVNSTILIQKPAMYKIIMLNDDFTPMDFVVYILENFFQKDNQQAIEIMLEIHNTGIGNCGIYTYKIAETKRSEVLKFAKKHQYPLQCVLEKE